MTVEHAMAGGPHESAQAGGHRVRLFGALRVELAERSVSVPLGRARSLLVYLLLRPDVAHAREQLVELLWPDEPPARVGRGLADALYRLRSTLGPGVLAADRSSVRLTAAAFAEVDAWRFERLVGLGDDASLSEAVGLYGGELAPEIYDDWLLGPRAALADGYRSALATLAGRAEERGNLAESFRYYHWLTAADPLDETGHRGLMRAYVRSGHAAAAIQQFERLSTLLKAELAIEPSEATVRLADEARRVTGRPDRSAAEPFVGRRRERTSILGLLDEVRSGPRLILIEGEPGIGKSRLLDTLAEDARWRGFSVAVGRASADSAGLAYSPLDAALAEALPVAVFDRLRSRLGAAALEAATMLLPHAAERPAAGRSPERPTLAPGLAELLRQAAASRPWLLVLDDVHLGGPSFWEALRFLDQAAGVPVTVMLAFRSRELRARPFAWTALRSLDAGLAPLRLSLHGFGVEEGRELARALGRQLTDDELATVVRASGGNPLVLRQALATADGAVSGSGFAELLTRRLEMISPAARRAVEAAAVLGGEFSFADWLAVAADVPGEAIDESIDARLIVELVDRYAIEHELTREHVYRAIAPPLRPELHRRAAEALRRGRAPAEVVARHLELGGQPEEALAEYRRAAEEALARYAYREALEHVDRALALPAAEGGADPALFSLRHRLLGLLLRLDEWRSAMDVAEKAARAAGDSQALLEVTEGRLSLHTLEGDLGEMEEAGRQGLALSQEIGDQRAEARVLAVLGWHVSESLGDNRRALPMLRRAVRLAEQLGDDQTRIGALCSMSSALRSIGRCRAAHIAATRAMAAVELRPSLHRGRAHTLAELAETALELGRWEEAHAAMREAMAAYRQLDDPWSFGSALFGMVNICGGMGQAGEAVAAAEELVALSTSLGLAASSDYGVWHRVCLGRAWLAAGDAIAAESAIAEVAAIVPEASRPRTALLLLRGQLALHRGEVDRALDLFEGGFATWQARPEPRDVAVALWRAIGAARAGRPEAGRGPLTAAERALSGTDMQRHDPLRHFARWTVTGDGHALAEAVSAVERQAARFSDDSLRRAFFEEVPLHRQIAAARRTSPTAGHTLVRLARADVPLGRRLREDDLVEVSWVLPDAGAARLDGVPQRIAERRQRLLLLLEQARAAGAAPTDDQLAAALGVSRRTILRDVRAMVSVQPLPTRRRRGQLSQR